MTVDHDEQKKVRSSIKQMIADGISPMSIVMAHGRLVTPDEAELLTEYEKNCTPQADTEKGSDV